MCSTSTTDLLLLEIILQLNCSNMLILNYAIISLKPHGLWFLNMPLIELILRVTLFGAFNEIVLFYKSIYNLIVYFLHLKL